MTSWISRCFAVMLLFGVGFVGDSSVIAQVPGMPRFEADPGWLKMPAKWKLGEISSVAVDSHDHVWVLHRPRTFPDEPMTMATPPVLEFDPAGNFVQGWGAPSAGAEWPEREHGIYVDGRDNVWIGGNNCAARKLPGLKPVSDDQLLKLDKSGRLIMQIGRSDQGRGNSDTHNLRQPADAFVYPSTNEVFVADGYGNHRVIVLDADTGAFKRMWGAFGNTPMDDDRCPPRGGGPITESYGTGPQQFSTVHAVHVSRDGFVYVADRENRRVQVFTLQGAFVKQAILGVIPGKLASQVTPAGLAFSGDTDQRFLYASGRAEIVALDRKTLTVLGSFPNPYAHHLAADSKGNLYTAESDERRVQRLVFKGTATPQ